MSKKKTDEEKRQEADAKESTKFFAQEKAEYERRMTLAAKTDEANAEAEDKEIADDLSDEDGADDGDDQDDVSSEENEKGETNP